jgi:hypothetical protein
MNTRINIIAAKKLLWLAVGLVLLVNAFILGQVYMNRSGVIAQLQLSERELQFPRNYGFSKEDSSLRVDLHWTTPVTEPTDMNLNGWRWRHNRQLQLNDANFLSFQFPDCTQKTRMQERSAWVLLEFNGQSYTDYVVQVERYHALTMGLTPAQNAGKSEKELVAKRKDATEFLTEAKTESSRLFVIDAAADRGLLETAVRNRQSTDNSQLFILPAELRALYYRCNKSEKRTTEVIIDKLAVESLYIPNYLSQHFPKDRDARRKAKFTMEVSYGRFFEPWVSGFISTTEKKHVMP